MNTQITPTDNLATNEILLRQAPHADSPLHVARDVFTGVKEGFVKAHKQDEIYDRQSSDVPDIAFGAGLVALNALNIILAYTYSTAQVNANPIPTVLGTMIGVISTAAFVGVAADTDGNAVQSMVARCKTFGQTALGIIRDGHESRETTRNALKMSVDVARMSR